MHAEILIVILIFVQTLQGCKANGDCIGGPDNPCTTYTECPTPQYEDCQNGVCIDLPVDVVRCEKNWLGSKSCADSNYKCDELTDICVPKVCGTDPSIDVVCDPPTYSENNCANDRKTIFRVVYGQSCDTSSNSCYSDEPRDETVETCSGTDVCENAECRAFDCNIDLCTDPARCKSNGECIGGPDNPCTNYKDCPTPQYEDCQSGTCIDLPPPLVRCEIGLLGGKSCADSNYKCDDLTDICVQKICGADFTCPNPEYSENFCSSTDSKTIFRTVYSQSCDTSINSCYSDEPRDETVETCSGTDVCENAECRAFDCNIDLCTDPARCKSNGECIGGPDNPCTSYKDCPTPPYEDCQSGTCIDLPAGLVRCEIGLLGGKSCADSNYKCDEPY